MQRCVSLFPHGVTRSEWRHICRAIGKPPGLHLAKKADRREARCHPRESLTNEGVVDALRAAESSQADGWPRSAIDRSSQWWISGDRDRLRKEQWRSSFAGAKGGFLDRHADDYTSNAHESNHRRHSPHVRLCLAPGNGSMKTSIIAAISAQP